jgi:N-acetylglucosaminyldiphosphoundecaprenol N-acetyl-beta-D-mannosaminyltransferase
LNYAMLTAKDPRLREVNEEAAFIVADGMPLVWASRWKGSPLPCRVAGSDMLPALCARAARRGYRVFLLGAAPGVAEEAARRLCRAYPGLTIAGIEAPDFHALSAGETEDLKCLIRESETDVLIAAMGQPDGEFWLRRNYRDLEHTVCAQFGASIDFAAGRVARAPKWMQKTGLEWAYRLGREPRRLTGRYARNALFLARAFGRGAVAQVLRRTDGVEELAGQVD